MTIYLCPICGHTQGSEYADFDEIELGCKECGHRGDMIEGNACLRCEEFCENFTLCDKCLDELDAFAAEALKAIATEEQIEEWCYVHDIKRGENHESI